MHQLGNVCFRLRKVILYAAMKAFTVIIETPIKK